MTLFHETTDMLSREDQSRLQAYEAVITQGLKTFLTVGQALLAIRDQRLYRQTHATFEAYCQERWGLERRRAYQLIEAAIVVSNIEGDVQNFSHRESHVAPLARLAPDEQQAVWQEAVETAPEGKVTAAHVEATVAACLAIKAALEEVAPFLGALPHDSEDALRESIRRFGVLVPVVMDPYGTIIDGRQRVRIARELGVTYRTRVILVKDAREALEIFYSLNVIRQHLPADERRAAQEVD